jgi:hypothetical protein
VRPRTAATKCLFAPPRRWSIALAAPPRRGQCFPVSGCPGPRGGARNPQPIRAPGRGGEGPAPPGAALSPAKLTRLTRRARDRSLRNERCPSAPRAKRGHLSTGGALPARSRQGPALAREGGGTWRGVLTAPRGSPLGRSPRRPAGDTAGRWLPRVAPPGPSPPPCPKGRGPAKRGPTFPSFESRPVARRAKREEQPGKEQQQDFWRGGAGGRSAPRSTSIPAA